MSTSKPSVTLDTFCGVWKRALQTRFFGSFMPSKDYNDVVSIERIPEDLDSPRKRGPRYRWSFGTTLEEVREGYTVEVVDVGGMSGGSSAPSSSAASSGSGATASPPPSSSSSSSAASESIPLLVTKNRKRCYGNFQQELGTLCIHLVGVEGNTSIIYRTIDEDTLAVSLTQVPPSTGDAIVQHGYLFRLHA